jgi:hypothetical protein
MQISHETREALLRDLSAEELELEAQRRKVRATVYSSSSFKEDCVELHVCGHLLHVRAKGEGGVCSLRREDITNLIAELQAMRAKIKE